MTHRLRFGISMCPNDTFAYHALLENKVDRRGLEIAVDLCDVEELNQGLSSGRFDAAKASFHAVLLAASDVCVLPVGSALGFGVGPLLLAAKGRTSPGDPVLSKAGVQQPARVLSPGQSTTANLLYRLFHAGQGLVEHRVFSEILPALALGQADFGICIHEARFTWRRHGLSLVADLGDTWERATGLPLPLGGVAARKALGADVLGALTEILRDSLDYAWKHRDEVLPTMRRHAQEHSDDVLWAHVDTYVTPFTAELGDTGKRALDALAEMARATGLLPEHNRGIYVFEPRTPDPSRAKRLFHIAHAAEWKLRPAIARAPQWKPRPLPPEHSSLAKDGFIHLSFQDQLRETLERHFAREGDLVLIEVDPARVGADLRLEPSDRGALFPHLYRPLGSDDIVRTWRITRTRAGWRLPDLDAVGGSSVSRPGGSAPL